MKPYLPYRPYLPYLAGAAGGAVAVTLASIAVTPDAGTINDGATQQFTATGTYSDSSTADITGTVTWDSSNDAVATITAGGLATGAAPGQVTISATLGAVSGTTTLDIAAVPLFADSLTDLAIAATGTFTRASVAYHQNPDGFWRDGLSGEARWKNARRVRNLATSLVTQTITVVSGRKYQVAIKGNNGTTAACSGAFTGTLTADGTNYISWASGTPKTSGSSSLTVTVTGTLSQLMVEDVTAQTSQLPSSYIAGNAAHNAVVNGVKYFATANGNTVDANGVVTEATGSALAGPFGLLMEHAETNLQTQSSSPNLGSGSNAGSVTDSGILGQYGVNFAKWLPNTSVSHHICYWPVVTLASNIAIYARFVVKKLGYRYLNLDFNDGQISATRAIDISIDLDTGELVATRLKALTSYTSVLQSDGSWEITLGIPELTTTSRGSGFSPASVVQASRANFAGTGTDGALFAATMMTLTAPGSWISTVGSAVTRAVDALAYSGIAADNETRLVIGGVNVDSADWNGTVPTPTVPNVLSDVKVYAPGERPA